MLSPRNLPKGAPLLAVEIIFKSGERVQLDAEEFDIELQKTTREHYAVLNPYTYKARNGREATIWLTPSDVSGVVVFPVGR
jgi:hypothetical protein